MSQRPSTLWPSRTITPNYGTVKVNGANPLARGLVGFWICNEGGGTILHDLATTNHGTLPASPVVWGATGAGRGLVTPGGVNSGQITIAAPTSGLTGLVTAAKWTMMAWLVPSASKSYCIPLALGGEGFVERASYYSILAANASQVRVLTAVSAGRLYRLVGTRDSTTYTIYLDGVPSTTANFEAGFGATTYYTMLDGLSHSSSYQYQGAMICAGAWNRVLDQGEINLVTFNPYCLIRPVHHRSYGWKAAAGGARLAMFLKHA
jgi:hypothetical protein